VACAAIKLQIPYVIDRPGAPLPASVQQGFCVGKAPQKPLIRLFSGTAVNRVTNTPVAAASVFLNGVTTTTEAVGPTLDQGRFVMNLSKSGFALTSQTFYARATDVHIPMDPVQIATIDGNGGTGSISYSNSETGASNPRYDNASNLVPTNVTCIQPRVNIWQRWCRPEAVWVFSNSPVVPKITRIECRPFRS
jgi:hypothetical protein